MEDKLKDLELDVLTDQDILSISKGRFISNPKDFNLSNGPKGSKKKGKSNDNLVFVPEPGGLYDGRIFGSMYENRCNCGAVTTRNVPCYECGTMALDPVDRTTRYAAIDLRVLYSSPIKISSLHKYLKSIFNMRVEVSSSRVYNNDSRSEYDLFNFYYLLQFNYIKEKNVLLATDELTDSKYVSLEGIELILKEHKPEKLDEFYRYVNRLIPVLPAFLRRVKLYRLDGKKKVKLPKSTAYYRSLIKAKDICMAKVANSDIYTSTAYLANLRLYASNVLMKCSGFYKSSKQTFMRANSYQTRMNKSGRAVIVGDPDLRLDQLGIPTFMAYEMMKKDFIIYMRDELGVAENQIAKLYNNPSDSLLNEFKRYAETRVVLFNRAPTLMRTSIQAFRVKCFDDYVIHLPLSVTTSFNADFDGDACMVYLMPAIYNEYCLSKASPLVNTNYAYNDSPIYKPKHEIMHGLSISSKFIPNEDGEIKRYVSFSDMEEDYFADELWVNETVQLGDRVTTYGREKLAKIIKVDDLSNYIGDDYIKASNVKIIYNILNKYDGDERLDIIKEMEHFVLEVVTLEGATTIPLKDLYYEVPEEFKERVRAIINSDMPEADKIREAEVLYSEILESMENNYSKEQKEAISDTDRAKFNSIISMVSPQFSIDSKCQVHFSENAMVEGLSEYEYLFHSADNREIIKAKAEFVPLSGFLNRQAVEAGRRLVCKEGESDEQNQGILLPANIAEGRTAIDGTLVPKTDSTEYVRVRSILGSNKPYSTPDMFSTKVPIIYDDGISYIGLAWLTEMMQNVTQSGLAFKHGGTIRDVEKSNKFYAPYDTEVEILEDRIHLLAKDEYYIKPTKFSTRGNGFYKKGKLIGEVPKYITATYRAEALVRFLSAQGSIKDFDLSNKIELTHCFNGSKPAKVELSSDGKTIKIGNLKYKRDSRMVIYPIGSEVPPYQRFCAGVQNMRNFNKSRLQTKFEVFRNAMSEFVDVRCEILEILYYLISNGGKDYLGILTSNTSNNHSALSAIAYGYSKKNLVRIVNRDLNIDMDDSYTHMNLAPVIVKLIQNILD